MFAALAWVCAHASAASGVVDKLFVQSGVGAVARTQADKARETVSAFDFMTAAQIANVKAGTATVDVGAALQKALIAGTGRTTIIPKGVYRSSVALTVFGSVRCDGSTLKFYGTTITSLVSQSVDGSLRGCTIDGANVTNVENGLLVNTDFVQAGTAYYDLKIKSLSNTSSTKGVNGALFLKASNAAVNLNSKLDIKIDVEDITATANSVIGDTGGSSTGILISFNGTGTDSHVVVRDSTIKNILPAEDSGGIQIFVGDHTAAGAKGLYAITNAKIYNARKRGVKIQSQNTTVRDTTVFGQNTDVGFDTYAVNTVFDNSRYVLGSSTGFRTSGAATRIFNSVAETNSQQPILRLDGASNVIVAHSQFTNSATLGSTANSVVFVDSVANSLFDNVAVANTVNTGSGFSVAGTCDIRFSKGAISGTAFGVYLAYSAGNFSLINSSVNALTNGFARLGDTGQIVTVKNSTIAAAIGLNLGGTGNTAVAIVSDSVINANTHGILAKDGSRIIDTQVTSTAVTGAGISAGNSIARGNRITKYAVGISYTYTATAEVADNVTIGTTTPYETTGFTPFVNHNNQSR